MLSLVVKHLPITARQLIGVGGLGAIAVQRDSLFVFLVIYCIKKKLS